MNVVLIGFRGCGKSTVGRALAERLGWTFVDTDVRIEERTGLTIREVFTDHAERAFRDLESQVIAELADVERHVVSTGGGAILRSRNVDMLRQLGKLVYLTAPAEVLWGRIFQDLHRHATRLRLNPDTGLQQVRHSLTEREPLYLQAADCVVETTGRSLPGIVDRVITRTGLRRA